MKYRARNNDGKYVYHETIQGVVKVAAEAGSIIGVKLYPGHDTWSEIGLAFGGKFYDSVKYIDAFNLFHGWYARTSPQEFAFANIVEAGEIEFPVRQCGYDNLLNWARTAKAIRPGNRWSSDCRAGVYHYVVTDYGRELAVIIRALFLGPRTAFTYEQSLIAESEWLEQEAQQNIKAKLTPVWDDADALEQAIKDCPFSVTKCFAFDQIRQLRGQEST